MTMTDTVSPVPTAREAVAMVPQGHTDKDTVAAAQRGMLAKGYVDGGPPTGEFGQKTKDEILVFRSRNNMPLVPIIDDDFIRMLQIAPPKALPIEQVTATKEEIAPKVEVVAIGEKVQRSAFWTKIWAFFTGLPAGFVGLMVLIIENLDEASEFIAPLKTLLFDFQGINPLVWIGLIVVIAGVMGYQAMTISKLSRKLEDAAVEGYQRGTIKNDVPIKEEAKPPLADQEEVNA